MVLDLMEKGLFNYRFGRNCINFEEDRSSSVHVDNKKMILQSLVKDLHKG